MSPVTHVVKRSGRLVEFDPRRITNAVFKAALGLQGDDMERAEEVSARVTDKVNATFGEDNPPTVEDIQDIVVATLREMDHGRTADAYQRYREEHARQREEKESAIVVEDTIPYKILWQVYTWNVEHGCHSVEALNEHVRRGTLPDLIEAAEELYHGDIDRLAQKITGRRDEVRIVIIAGPSSSGKTTTTIKLSEALRRQGIELIAIGLDDYFKDLESHPKDEFGDYDFENPEALDLDLINRHLLALMRGESIQMPKYNFKTGKREAETHEFHLGPGQMLLIDSLHGLYGPMTDSVPAPMKFKFYIEALCQIRDTKGEFVRWADLRMLRRMVRDSWHRSYSPEKTVGHWHYVRRSEMRHIVPYIGKADHVINGSLAYELCVHSRRMGPLMDGIVKAYEDQPKRYDAVVRATRVRDLLRWVEPIRDEGIIPRNSLMREYIGGSIYTY
ncbi:MAG: response regulator SirA [Candidatus Sumerlaeia bacterium]|nr:response regulator SirA [Candidatus Sumerlaeia bacterium]